MNTTIVLKQSRCVASLYYSIAKILQLSFMLMSSNCISDGTSIQVELWKQ